MPAAFRCPQCSECTLKITAHLEIPPDRDWDEITLQIVGCSSCGLGALAVYQESRRGSLETEAWQHNGYRIDPPDVRRLTEVLNQCPRPNDSSCLCSAHLELGLTNNKLQWEGISKIALLQHFQLESCK